MTPLLFIWVFVAVRRHALEIRLPGVARDFLVAFRLPPSLRETLHFVHLPAMLWSRYLVKKRVQYVVVGQQSCMHTPTYLRLRQRGTPSMTSREQATSRESELS